MDLWIKFALTVFFGVWGFYAGFGRKKREGSNQRLVKLWFAAADFAMPVSTVILGAVFIFWLIECFGGPVNNPPGVGFLSWPALAFFLGGFLGVEMRKAGGS